MSEKFGQCKNCGAFCINLSFHECPPEWQAVRPDYGDPDDPLNFYRAFGYDGEEAAQWLADANFAEWEYPSEIEIWVRQRPSSDWEKYKIVVNHVPSFSAQKI